LLWQVACEYFEWCDENPLVKKETHHKILGVETKEAETARPYTLSGLCICCGTNRHWWKQFKKGLKEDSHDFYPVVRQIEDVIYAQKFEGAAAGHFNANIIARDLGLGEKVEQDITAKVSISPKQWVSTNKND